MQFVTNISTRYALTNSSELQPRLVQLALSLLEPSEGGAEDRVKALLPVGEASRGEAEAAHPHYLSHRPGRTWGRGSAGDTGAWHGSLLLLPLTDMDWSDWHKINIPGCSRARRYFAAGRAVNDGRHETLGWHYGIMHRGRLLGYTVICSHCSQRFYIREADPCLELSTACSLYTLRNCTMHSLYPIAHL